MRWSIRLTALLVCLLLPAGFAPAQSMTAGKQEYKISKLVKKPDAKGVVISLSVLPAVDVTKGGIGLAFFAPAGDPAATLGSIQIGGGEFNWSFAQNGRPEYWASRLHSQGGKSIGPLTVIRLAPEHLTRGIINIRADHVETSGQFGMPAKFPLDARFEVALARIRWTAKEREGLVKGDPIFVLVSNVLSIGPAGKEGTR